MRDESHSLSDFDGILPVFPLPNLVMFPHLAQPLHIFEPRYRQMTKDVLADDLLLALALLQPGWEGEYEGCPEIYQAVCVCKIIADEELEDGRFNLMVRGLCRARILDEHHTDKLYRLAEVELLPDIPVDNESLEKQIRRTLIEQIRKEPIEQNQLNQLSQTDISMGLLCDILGFALPLPLPFRQQLLEECDVRKRCLALIAHLKANNTKSFPPDFSLN